jgi:hypothetical protein
MTSVHDLPTSLQARAALSMVAPSSNPAAPVGGVVSVIFGASSSGEPARKTWGPGDASEHSVLRCEWEQRYTRPWQTAVHVCASATLASSDTSISEARQPTCGADFAASEPQPSDAIEMIICMTRRFMRAS